MNIKEFTQKIKSVEKKYNFKYKLSYQFPFSSFHLFSDEFDSEQEEDNELIFCKWLDIEISSLRKILNTTLTLIYYNKNIDYDKIKTDEPSLHWSNQHFAQLLGIQNSFKSPTPNVKVVHFYGYKGGQGRSTMLASLASTLARDGWRVLVLDCDFEAPSLHVILKNSITTNIQSTILGIYLNEEKIEPKRALIKNPNESGFVDILLCRPTDSEWDVEYSVLTLKSMTDPFLVKSISAKIMQFSEEKKYDIILIDHRSGISSSPFFWVNMLPGPIAFFTKLDNQWRGVESFLKSFFSISEEVLLITLKPPVSETDDEYKSSIKIKPQIDTLKGLILDSKDVYRDEVSIDDMEDIIILPHSIKFIENLLPDIFDNDLKSVISTVRERLDILDERNITNKVSGGHNISGTKESYFIHTQAYQELIDSPEKCYIFGRKGTGKTTLYKKLYLNRIIMPLLCPEDFDEGGLKSNSLIIEEYSYKMKKNKSDSKYELFWYILICAALELDDTNSDLLSKRFKKILDELKNNSILEIVDRILDILNKSSANQSFGIDGIETLKVNDSYNEVPKYVKGIFSVMRYIQNQEKFINKIRIKVFLRMDLKPYDYQDLEKQIYTRDLYLKWDTQEIFNFLLTRIYGRAWFKDNFAVPYKKIEDSFDQIRRGELEKNYYDKILNGIFPNKSGFLNISMMAFFDLYFSDQNTYYPRVYEYFVNYINTNNVKYSLERGKISQKMIKDAYQDAAGKFLKEVKQEIRYVLDNLKDNEIEELIKAFNGQSSPFVLKTMVTYLQKKLVRINISKDNIEISMDRLEKIGIFEKRQDNKWSVGRIFRYTLGMKLARARG